MSADDVEAGTKHPQAVEHCWHLRELQDGNGADYSCRTEQHGDDLPRQAVEAAPFAASVNRRIAAAHRPVNRNALPRNSGAARLDTSAHASNAANGIVIGLRQRSAEGSLATVNTPAASAAATESSSVVNVKPNSDPGSGRSKGETAATSNKLAGTAHEPTDAVEPRAGNGHCDVRQEWLSSATFVPGLCLDAIRHARCINSQIRALRLARDALGFPQVKLLSRCVTLTTGEVPLRIVLKALADVTGKAAMLAITVVAARRLNPDPFAILAFATATGWLLGVATDAGLSMYLARETARGGVSEPRRGRQFVLEIVSLRAGLAFVAATIVLFVTPSLVPRHWRVQFVLVVAAQLCRRRSRDHRALLPRPAAQ